MTKHKQNAHLTHKPNLLLQRHGWLRLTPAYSVELVNTAIEKLHDANTILDPFSGTGTTAVVAAQRGLDGTGLDINPFLVWLGNAKLNDYSGFLNEDFLSLMDNFTVHYRNNVKSHSKLWAPPIFRIERWWSPKELATLRVIRQTIDDCAEELSSKKSLIDLLEVTFCQYLIACSKASFNHQSMSFKDPVEEITTVTQKQIIDELTVFLSLAEIVFDNSKAPLLGTGRIFLHDSLNLLDSSQKFDAVVTSPPYVNRMSYIRELRPYLYWLRYLGNSAEAGILDWKAIGGTWGSATSNLSSWQRSGTSYVDSELLSVTREIAKASDKYGTLLATYVEKYFVDMASHFETISKLVKVGGSVSYIIGNSTFYGVHVPAHEWYKEALFSCGFSDVEIQTIRKRNSNKQLFEFQVSAIR